MEDGEWKDDLQGTPQGAVVSPILANVYLHYVLDLWFQKKWRARKATGDTIIVRYADDFVVGCQRKADAEQFLLDLKERMGQFALEAVSAVKEAEKQIKRMAATGALSVPHARLVVTIIDESLGDSLTRTRSSVIENRSDTNGDTSRQ